MHSNWFVSEPFMRKLATRLYIFATYPTSSTSIKSGNIVCRESSHFMVSSFWWATSGPQKTRNSFSHYFFLESFDSEVQISQSYQWNWLDLGWLLFSDLLLSDSVFVVDTVCLLDKGQYTFLSDWTDEEKRSIFQNSAQFNDSNYMIWTCLVTVHVDSIPLICWVIDHMILSFKNGWQ